MASRRRQRPDQVLVDIADYVVDYRVRSPLAYETARYCLLDALGCALEALEYPACTKLLGPVVEGSVLPDGARVPGTNYRLDPVQAAFNIGAAIRWLDFNDTWLAAEWGHPSDNPGGILAVADWLSRQAAVHGTPPPQMRHVLTALIKAYDQDMRSIANRLKVTFVDGTCLDPITCRYPVGHRRRRREGIPLLEAKFRKNLARRFSTARREAIVEASTDQQTLESMAVHDYLDLYATKRLLRALPPASGRH